MIDTSSWDQSFLEAAAADDAPTSFALLRYRAPSDSDTTLASIVAAREGTALGEAPSRRLAPVRRHSTSRRSSHAAAADSFLPRALPVFANPDRCFSVPPDCGLADVFAQAVDSGIEEVEQSHPSITAGDFRQIKFSLDRFSCENAPALSGSGNNLPHDGWCNAPQVTSSGRGLLLPVGIAIDRKPSSSSSVSCDSVLDHGTGSSSWCSGSSDCTPGGATAAVGNPFADELFPDNGNGGSDAAADRFRFPVQSPDPATGKNFSYSVVASFLPEWDSERLGAAYARLSECGFYYGRLSADAAAERLRRGAAIGTFLLRDSADDRFLFSVSAQTRRGLTSIRVLYRAGLFSLDSAAEQEHLTPMFDCPLKMIVHYVRACCGRRRPGGGGGYVLLESSGRRDTPVVLRTPLYRRVEKLSHLSRRAVHAALSRGEAAHADPSAMVDRLQLVPSLRNYLKHYPYEL